MPHGSHQTAGALTHSTTMTGIVTALDHIQSIDLGVTEKALYTEVDTV